MKSVYIIIALLFISLSFAQSQKATVFLKNGEEIKGLAKINNQATKIKFKKDRKSEKIYYDHQSMLGLIIRSGDRDIEFKFKVIKDNQTPKLLEVLEEGKVSLYRDLKQGYTPAAPPGPGGIFYGGSSFSISRYYASKNNDHVVEHLGTKGSFFTKNFKKAASEYFKDCQKLVDKIQKKEFKKRDILEIVEFYNDNCN